LSGLLLLVAGASLDVLIGSEGAVIDEDECGVAIAADALATRKRFRSVEHDHDTPPCTKAGRHKSSDSPLTAPLKIQDLKCAKPLYESARGEIAEARPFTASYSAGFERKDELANITLRFPGA
jgi:hypothetical protein